MQDWNQDGKVDEKDAAIFHTVIKSSGKEEDSSHRSSASNTGKRKTNIPAIIAGLYLAVWISGGIPINGFTGFLALICVIVLGYAVFNWT